MPAKKKMCRNKVHPLPAGRTHCTACATQKKYRYIARSTGAPLCDNKHGLVAGNVTDTGVCAECVRQEPISDDPALEPFPAAVWLDWAAVQQAIDGRELTRALTKRELLCLVTTIRSRNPEFTRDNIVQWVQDSTRVVGLTMTFLEYLEWTWGPRRSKLARPFLTVNQAVTADVTGTAEDGVADDETEDRELPRRPGLPAAPVTETEARRVGGGASRRIERVQGGVTNLRQRVKPDGTLLLLCTRCAQEKLLSEFGRSGAGNGRSTYCEPCEAGMGAEASYRRHARKVGVPVKYVVIGERDQRVTPETVVARYGDACWYQVDGCTGGHDRTVHHVSVRDYGPHTLDNVRPACTFCSRRREPAVA